MEAGTKGTILALTSLLANVLRFRSISGKNATLAGQIEISYPVFVALFAFVLFREIHVNTSVIVGGLMVSAGVALTIRIIPACCARNEKRAPVHPLR